MSRRLFLILGLLLLAGPAQGQPAKKEDPFKAELDKLRTQVQELQTHVKALQKKESKAEPPRNT